MLGIQGLSQILDKYRSNLDLKLITEQHVKFLIDIGIELNNLIALNLKLLYNKVPK